MSYWYGVFTVLGLLVIVVVILIIAYFKWALNHWGF